MLYNRGINFASLYAHLLRYNITELIIVKVGELPPAMLVTDQLMGIQLDVQPVWEDATKRTTIGRVSYHIGRNEGHNLYVLSSQAQLVYTSKSVTFMGYGLRDSLRARTDIDTLELPRMTVDWSDAGIL